MLENREESSKFEFPVQELNDTPIFICFRRNLQRHIFVKLGQHKTLQYLGKMTCHGEEEHKRATY